MISQPYRTFEKLSDDGIPDSFLISDNLTCSAIKLNNPIFVKQYNLTLLINAAICQGFLQSISIIEENFI